MSSKTALIIGAGPAGLTAAWELLQRTEVKPIVLEASREIGGISRTVRFHGNRIDIGGHRFFSKSDRVMDWWLDMMPVDEAPPADPGTDTRLLSMLVRNRRSRVLYLRRFFNYPIGLSRQTLAALGPPRVVRIALSYLKSSLRPIRPEANLEQFFVNRFGRELYRTFFESYTEKVWGVPCHRIGADWGAQRVKGLSVRKAVLHAVRAKLRPGSSDIRQKQTETSLIDRFLYPKLGPGQMWERVAERVADAGGEVRMESAVNRLTVRDSRVVEVEVTDARTAETRTLAPDYVFSSMPVRELVRSIDGAVPAEVREVADGLVYRDFITVGLLLDRLELTDPDNPNEPVRDNWIYIQEADVRVGRMQVFNNWSPYLLQDRSKTWVGLEYFCNVGDDLWSRTEAEMIDLAKAEMERLGICRPEAVRDATVIRVEKAYPAYFGTYDRMATVRDYLDGVENLFLVGRNGMHRYNNQDHSMLTAMVAVDQIAAGSADKSPIWAVNTEETYHEERQEA